MQGNPSHTRSGQCRWLLWASPHSSPNFLVVSTPLGCSHSPGGNERSWYVKRAENHTLPLSRLEVPASHLPFPALFEAFLFIFLPHWEEIEAFPVLCMEAALCCNPVLTAELECLLLAGSLGWDVGKPSLSHPAPAGESWDRPYSSSNVFQPIPLPTKTVP